MKSCAHYLHLPRAGGVPRQLSPTADCLFCSLPDGYRSLRLCGRQLVLRDALLHCNGPSSALSRIPPTVSTPLGPRAVHADHPNLPSSPRQDWDPESFHSLPRPANALDLHCNVGQLLVRWIQPPPTRVIGPSPHVSERYHQIPNPGSLRGALPLLTPCGCA